MKDKTKENYQVVELETLYFDNQDIVTSSRGEDETPDVPFPLD